jgi:hypothetical protein
LSVLKGQQPAEVQHSSQHFNMEATWSNYKDHPDEDRFNLLKQRFGGKGDDAENMTLEDYRRLTPEVARELIGRFRSFVEKSELSILRERPLVPPATRQIKLKGTNHCVLTCMQYM